MEIRKKQLKGIKKGKTIELLEELNILDGQEIIVEIQYSQLMSPEERRQKIKEFLEAEWEGREDFIRTMEELQREKEQQWEKLYGNYSD